MSENSIENGRSLALLSYITIIGTIVAYFINKDKNNNSFAFFHTRQALGIWLSFHAIAILISTIDSGLARFIFYAFFGFLIIYGFINAFVGNEQEVPILGKLYQKWFANMGR